MTSRPKFFSFVIVATLLSVACAARTKEDGAETDSALADESSTGDDSALLNQAAQALGAVQGDLGGSFGDLPSDVQSYFNGQLKNASEMVDPRGSWKMNAGSLSLGGDSRVYALTMTYGGGASVEVAAVWAPVPGYVYGEYSPRLIATCSSAGLSDWSCSPIMEARRGQPYSIMGELPSLEPFRGLCVPPGQCDSPDDACVRLFTQGTGQCFPRAQ